MNSSKKNGFTLIELLVVMILIAVLGLFVYPSVLNLYNQSRKNIFVTESINIFKLSVNEYRTEIMKPNGKKKEYIKYNDDSALSSVSEDYKYCVKLDEKGYVTEIKVATSKYYIKGDSELDNLTNENVQYGVFDHFDCDYELREEDKREELSVEEIRDTAKYKTALKYLLIAFGVSVVASLIASRKAR